MLTDLTSIRVEAWTDFGTSGNRNVFALHLDRPDSAKGLRRVWFVLEERELDAMANGTTQALEDGYHKLSVFGDSCTFYDFMPPGAGAGIVEVPYFAVQLPRVFWRYLRRIARFIWRDSVKAKAKCDEERGYWRGERTEVQIPLATLARFQATYGHGTGSVDARLSERFVRDVATRPDLREQAERITTIARNYTRSKWSSVILRVTDDGEGYYWSTVDTKGRRGLCGGIYNHGKEGKDDWSIHT